MITNQTWPRLPAFATVRRKGAVNPAAAAEAVRGFLAFYTQHWVSGQAGADKGMLGMPGSADLPTWTREGMPEL